MWWCGVRKRPTVAVPGGLRDHPRSKLRSKRNRYEPGNRYEPAGGRIPRKASALPSARHTPPGATPEFHPSPYRSGASHPSRACAPGNMDAPACRKNARLRFERRDITNCNSSVVTRKRQGPIKRLCLYFSIGPVSRCHGRCLSSCVDSDDPLIRDQSFNKPNWFAVVVFVDDHHVPPGITLRTGSFLG